MSEKAVGRESDKFMLRFPEGMRDRIKDAAASNNRSMNAEIIARLEASLPPQLDLETDIRPHAAEIMAQIQGITRELHRIKSAIDEAIHDAKDKE